MQQGGAAAAAAAQGGAWGRGGVGACVEGWVVRGREWRQPQPDGAGGAYSRQAATLALAHVAQQRQGLGGEDAGVSVGRPGAHQVALGDLRGTRGIGRMHVRSAVPSGSSRAAVTGGKAFRLHPAPQAAPGACPMLRSIEAGPRGAPGDANSAWLTAAALVGCGASPIWSAPRGRQWDHGACRR